ncbi:MAG: 3,5-cyclic-AMP phosphodiesterase [Actinomycetota bacterium]|nr:3,5-cyclic-AMP phosphodiesterase [Actinomycetota bacterium]
MIVVAQLSDTHLDGSDARTERADRVIRYLRQLDPPADVVLLTGDVADHGLPEEYDAARALLSSYGRPVLTCPGNHDERAAYRERLLGAPPSTDPVNEVHDEAGALFAMCDSSIPGEADGYLADETLTWLDATLSNAPEVPAFVCFHHPPVILAIPYVDAIRQRGEQRLAEIIGRHPHVVAVICGHAHAAAASTFAGRPLLVGPGVVSTLTLPREPRDTVDHDLPPGIAFHILDEERRLTTHYRVVP